ncbi:MAG TPA: hypothetical protein VFR02_10775, partial [bacterium]|nr:hypothetical protein [bacterium]
MRKKVMGVAWSFLLLALGSDAPLQAQTTPRFFLDRMVEVQGFAPQAGDEAREAGRESALLRKLEAKAGTAAVRLPASPRFSPRPGERLWVFYGSACRGSAVVKGLKAQKVPGPIPARAWFELDASSLPATVNGNGHWLERAVYLEARPSDKEP